MLSVAADNMEQTLALPMNTGQAMAAYFARHDALVGGAHAGVSVRERTLAGYGLLRARYGAGSCFEVSGRKDCHALCVVLSGVSNWHHRDQSLQLSAGDVVALNPADAFTISHCSPAEYLVFRMPSAYLEHKATEYGYHVPAPGVRFRTEKIATDDALRLYHLLSALHQEDGASVSGAQIIGPYASIIAHLAITRLPNNLRRFHMTRPAPNPLIERVRRHVIEHRTEDIRVEALASLCRLSVKSVYNLFERELGISPSLYVRNLKLEFAHIALTENGRARNVTAVALEYGFRNLSRFASYYRECFGELPSQTLRRTGQQAFSG